MKSEFLNLNTKLEKLKNSVEKNERKYYHFRSVSNFIYHINDKRLSNQNFVVDNLSAFFDLVESRNIESIHESLSIFNEFLEPVGKLYEKDLNFFIMVKPWILNIWIIIFGIFFYMLNSKIYLIIFLSALFLFSIYLAYKIYKRKVYAFMW